MVSNLGGWSGIEVYPSGGTPRTGTAETDTGQMGSSWGSGMNLAQNLPCNTISPLGVLHVLTKKFRWKRALCRHKTQLHYAWAVGFPLLPAPLDSYQEVWKLHIPNEKKKIFIIKSEMFQCNWLLADFKVCLSDPHAAKPTQYKQWWSGSGWGWWYMWLYQNLHWICFLLSPRQLIHLKRWLLPSEAEGGFLICSILLSLAGRSVENIGYMTDSVPRLCH